MSTAKLATGNNGVGLDASALRKGMKVANFDDTDGLINQPADSERILQLGRYGYTVTRGTAGEYYVSNGAVVRMLPSFEALQSYAGEPGGKK